MRHALALIALACTAFLAGCAAEPRTPPPSQEASRASHERAAAEQEKAFKALDTGAAK